MTDKSSELQFLIDETARIFSGRLETTTDFDALAERIETSTHERISSSTLKRIWGYVSMHPRPRTATLDILSRFVGRRDFLSLCEEIKQTSGFLSTEKIDSALLAPGSRLILRWLPDRCVTVQYNGNNRYTVLDGGSSKLREGDVFEAFSFLKGHPLYLDHIERNGEVLPSYVAGRSAGLQALELD
ncbi:MAG: hypothetical protein J6O51_06510 [Bacteroidales bacterium]|nr:hypothetical protein [Bacteroidales bacterium]